MTIPDGIILFGPPASGKDTIATSLCAVRSDYTFFQKLKVGTGRGAGYRSTSPDGLALLRKRGLLLQESSRYGNQYAVDRPELDRLVTARRIPIVHAGRVADVDAIMQYPLNWTSVLLWCSKAVAAERLAARGDMAIAARLEVWEATALELACAPSTCFRLAIRTDHCSPEDAAATIDLHRRMPTNDGSVQAVLSEARHPE